LNLGSQSFSFEPTYFANNRFAKSKLKGSTVAFPLKPTCNTFPVARSKSTIPMAQLGFLSILNGKVSPGVPLIQRHLSSQKNHTGDSLGPSEEAVDR